MRKKKKTLLKKILTRLIMSFDADERIQKEFVPTKWGFGCGEDFFGPEIGMAETLSQKEET